MNGSVEKIRATLGCEVDAAGQFNNPSIASVLLDIKVSIEALAVAVHETASGSRPGSAISECIQSVGDHCLTSIQRLIKSLN